MSGTQTLSEAGQKLADARVEAAMDAFYPGEDWRTDLGIALPDSLRDMRAAIAAADAVALLFTPHEGEGAGLREAIVKADLQIGDGHIESARRTLHAAMDTPLASPQPAVEGPVAAGVDDAAYEAAWNEYRWMGGPGYTDSSASTAFLEGWNAARALTPPADPKPTVPGNDAGMRKGPSAADHDRAWVAAEYRVTGSPHEHTASDSLAMARYILSGQPPADRELRPCPEENENLCCFPSCNCARHRLAPQTGSAGEAPKTPDAGVGGAPHLSDLRGLFKDHYVAAALAQPTPVGEDETGVREAPAPLAPCPFCGASAQIASRLASNYGTTVQYVVTCTEAPAYCPASHMMGFTSNKTAALAAWNKRAAIANHPPKAETSAGVGEPFDLGDCAPDFPSAVAVEVMGLAWTHAPGDDVDEHCNRYGAVQEIVDRVLRRPEFAALSAAPAARPGDEIERVRHVKRGSEYEVLGEAEAQSPDGTHCGGYKVTFFRCLATNKLWCLFTDEFRDGRFIPAAAPAADGGRA